MTMQLRRRLAELNKAAAAGDLGAANRAAALAIHLDKRANAANKKEDDRIKVLLGAYVAGELAAGRRVVLGDAAALLAALDNWLVRPAERLAVLGSDGTGSPALRRVLGMTA